MKPTRNTAFTEGLAAAFPERAGRARLVLAVLPELFFKVSF
jgi:hypothetical protein